MIIKYSELVEQVARFLDRDDQADQIPEFISLAERNIYRLVRTPANEKQVLVTPQAAGRFQIPADFLEMRHLWVEGQAGNYLYLRPMSAIAGDQSEGTPKYWSRIGSDIQIWPYQSTVTDFSMVYYCEYEPLADTPEDESNPLFLAAPDLWLYGALLAAEPYLMNDARIGVWANEYAQRLSNVHTLKQTSEIGGGPLQLEAAHHGY